MPRPLRQADGNVVYHVLNRRIGRAVLFKDDADFAGFLKVLAESLTREVDLGRPRPDVYACCLMNNHWHLLVRPRVDGQLSSWMRWLQLTHTARYHKAHHSVGEGPLYQGRFKSFPVQEPGEGRDDGRAFWEVARYIEANPVRAGVVQEVGDWPWGSFALRRRGVSWLSAWPAPPPRDWRRQLDRRASSDTAEQLAVSLKRGRPYGSSAWVQATADRLGLGNTLRPRGRPRQVADK